MNSFDWFEFLMPIVIFILGLVFLVVGVYLPLINKQEIREMIIKDSSEYTTYKECIKINDLYYCK